MKHICSYIENKVKDRFTPDYNPEEASVTELIAKTFGENYGYQTKEQEEEKNQSLTRETLRDARSKKEFESKQIADFKDQFQWFLALGILLLFIDIFFLERKTAWLKKLNLFNEDL